MLLGRPVASLRAGNGLPSDTCSAASDNKAAPAGAVNTRRGLDARPWEAHAVTSDLHAQDPDRNTCPPWCVGRTGQPHDVDDLFGVHGTHHDSRLAVVVLGDDGSYLYVKASQFAPSTGADPWPAVVEVDAALSRVRRRSGPDSVWLYATEAAALVTALASALTLCEAVNGAA